MISLNKKVWTKIKEIKRELEKKEVRNYKINLNKFKEVKFLRTLDYRPVLHFVVLARERPSAKSQMEMLKTFPSQLKLLEMIKNKDVYVPVFKHLST